MRILYIPVFVFLTAVSNAQVNTYLADLTELRSIIEKTASFKAQIRGDKISFYNDLYNRLASDSINSPNTYKYFYNLAKLLFPLRDNHLGFYQLPNYSNFKSRESIDSFIATKEFRDYPTYNINVDSLKIELGKKPIESIEGIYYYDTFYTVGLFRNEENEYIGVIVDSDIGLWVKGQIAIHLYQSGPNLFKAIYGHPLFKYLMLQPIEKYQNQSLVNSYFYSSFSQSIYTKQLRQSDYVNIPQGSSKFVLRNLKEDVQYLLIQTFQTNTATSQASQRFYDSIKTLLKAPHLILDLRNNEGGADKETKKYLKLLKEYVKNGHLYVLVNNGTLSQAEIFMLELKRLNNVNTLGHQTKGMLSYGSNYGKTEKLPSGKIVIYPTDMNNGSELLQYEDYGINPDIILKDDMDWIEQVIAIIRKK